MDYSRPNSPHAPPTSEEQPQTRGEGLPLPERELPLPFVNILPSTPPQDARDEDARELADSREVLTSSPQPMRSASPAKSSATIVAVPIPQNASAPTSVPSASTSTTTPILVSEAQDIPKPAAVAAPAPKPTFTPAPQGVAGPSYTTRTPPSTAQHTSRQSSLTSPPPPPAKPIFPPPPAAPRSASPSSFHHGAPSRTTPVRIHEPLSMAGPYPVSSSEHPRADRTRGAQRSMSPRNSTGYVHAERARSMLESVNTDGNAAVHEKTVRERLAQTQTDALRERNKFRLQARATKWSLNGAIGVQVVLGALTTGIAASTSGKQTSIAVSVLGGLSTAAASYLAKMRGSDEPEFSASMCKDLKNFCRALDAYVDDHGAQSGEKHDAAVGRFRDEFERLLGNEKARGVAEVLKEGVAGLGHQAGGYLANAGQQAGARIHRGVEDLESGVRAGMGRVQSGVDAAERSVYGGIDGVERKVYGGVDYAERRVSQLASPLYSSTAAPIYSPNGVPGVRYTPPMAQYTPAGQLMALYTPSGQHMPQYTPTVQALSRHTPSRSSVPQNSPSGLLSASPPDSHFPPAVHSGVRQPNVYAPIAGHCDMV